MGVGVGIATEGCSNQIVSIVTGGPCVPSGGQRGERGGAGGGGGVTVFCGAIISGVVGDMVGSGCRSVDTSDIGDTTLITFVINGGFEL